MAFDCLPHQADCLPHQADCLPHQADCLPHQADCLPHQELAPRLLTQRSRDARARASQAAMHAKAASGPAAAGLATSRAARGDRRGATCSAEEDEVASREALSRALDEARASVALASRAAIEGYERITIFIRLYSRDTRPWIGFHTDLSTVTVNVALSADTSHKGGHLHTMLHTWAPSRHRRNRLQHASAHHGVTPSSPQVGTFTPSSRASIRSSSVKRERPPSIPTT
jgi:hypothetical protein